MQKKINFHYIDKLYADFNLATILIWISIIKIFNDEKLKITYK